MHFAKSRRQPSLRKLTKSVEEKPIELVVSFAPVADLCARGLTCYINLYYTTIFVCIAMKVSKMYTWTGLIRFCDAPDTHEVESKESLSGEEIHTEVDYCYYIFFTCLNKLIYRLGLLLGCTKLTLIYASFI